MKPKKPQPGARDRKIGLFVVSFLILFYELAFIRWLPSNILSLAYFANIVLISCFLGIGLGCMAARRRDLFPIFPLMLLGAVVIVLLCRNLEMAVPSTQTEWIWSSNLRSKMDEGGLRLGILPTLALVFCLNTALFVPLGQRMALLMESFAPIEAYTVNILGSLAGVILFALISFIGGYLNSPELWFGLAGVVSLWLFKESRKQTALAAAVLVAVSFAVKYSSRDDIWSPYYSIQMRPSKADAVRLFVNRFFHQEAANFDADSSELEKYSLPYRLKKPARVLILGAGTGNDIAVASRNGASMITAVEIDPVIVELGRQIHPNRPYDAAGVEVVVDDARSFLKRNREKFDMVIFGTLDSHALLSGLSTVRLDNYVYTTECLQDVKSSLAPEGIVVLMFSAPVEWIADRLIEMTARVYPDPPPLISLQEPGRLFGLMVLAGPGVARFEPAAQSGGFYDLGNAVIQRFKTEPSQGPPLEFAAVVQLKQRGTVPTDDWPYLYLRDRGVPLHYLKAIALLSVISIAAIWRLAPAEKKTRLDLNFFALGCAFMLLETKSVTTVSLLFGSTWLVNAFVFGAILAMILLANLFVLRKPALRVEPFYALLGVTLLVNFLVPPSLFLGQAYWARTFIPAILVALPLFFAGIIFAWHFKRARQLGWVFGSNLIGAVLGGFLEYASMAVGLNVLYLLAGAFYLVSYLSTRKGDAPELKSAVRRARA